MPSPNTVIQSIIRAAGLTDGVPIVTTSHYVAPAGIFVDLPSFANQFASIVWAGIQACTTTELSGIEIIHTVINGSGIHGQYIDGSIAGQTGALGGPTADYTQALIVRRYGPTNRRSDRGRIFLAPVQRSVFNDAGQAVTFPAAIGTLQSALISALIDGFGVVCLPCLWNKTTLVESIVITSSPSQRAGARKKRRFKP